MKVVDKRHMVYFALVLLCAVASVLSGPLAGAWTFVQIALVIEALAWLGRSTDTRNERI